MFASLAIAGLAVLACVSGHAEEVTRAQPDVGWLLDDKGCKVANPYPRPGAVVRWSGACVDGWAEGQGTLQWLLKGKPNLQYTGSVIHGLSHGEGVNLWPNGDRYEGEFARGVRTGHGLIQFANGSRYEGDFNAGQFQGEGVLTWPDGRAFEGHFDQGRPDGAGVYVSAGGRRTHAHAREGFIGAVGSGTNGTALASAVNERRPIDEQILAAMRRCPKLVPPQLPRVAWSGTASYFAVFSVIEDRVVSVSVRPIHSSGDLDVDDQLMTAITQGLERYECKGNFVFAQEFAFRVD